MYQQLPPLPPDPGTAPTGPAAFSAPPLTWLQAWIKALTQPSVRSYEEIANSSSASSKTAYQWIFVASTIGLVIEILISLVFNTTGYYQIGGATFTNTTGSPILSFCCAPVVGILAVIGFAIATGIVQLVARALGGTGTYIQLAYSVAAYSAPLSIISAAFYSIPTISLLNIVTGVAGIVLNVIAVKAVHQFGWGRAIVSSVVIWIIIFVVVAIVFLALIGPAIGGVFSNIVTTL
jgi:hypothetical protein